jgi:putative inorganic carbon (hco3(-)) transporter
MTARSRWSWLLPSSLLATAAALGVVAAIGPAIAIGVAAALVFAYIVFADFAAGFAILAFLSFLEILPTSGSLSPAKGAGLLLAVAWLARLSLRERDERDFFGDHPELTWMMIAFLGWGAITLLWATQTGPGITALSRYLPNLLLLPIAYAALRGRRDAKLVLAVIVAGAVLAAGFGILKPPEASIATEGRATGTIGDPNELAAALLVGLALAAGFALGRGRWPLLRLGALLAIPLCAAGIFLSLSRGGLIALAAVLVAGTMLAGRWRLAMTAVLVAVALGGVVYFTQIASLPARERITTSNGGSGRSDLWTVGLRMVRAHPVSGVGVGNFPVVSRNYVLQPGTLLRSDLIFSSEPKIAHNTYLQIAAETGVPGLLLFLGIVLACLSCTLRAARLWARRHDRVMEALARSLLLALIGMLVADFFISQMYSKLLWVGLALAPAMLAVARDEAHDSNVALSD